MKNPAGIMASAIVLILMAVPAAAATKVFLLGGQSNMAGVGGYPGDTGYLADKPLASPYSSPQTGVKFWNYGPNYVDQYGENNPTVGDGWVALQGGFGYKPSEFGPEVSFGYRLHQLFPGDNVYLVKYGISSQDLAVHWNPDGGNRYPIFKSRVDAAMHNLTVAGLSPTIAGMIWSQGDADALHDDWAAAYATNLTNFIGTVRSDFNTSNMPFVVARILPYWDYGTADNVGLVRAAQEAVPLQVSNVSWINTDDLERAYPGALRHPRTDRPRHTLCKSVCTDARTLYACLSRHGSVGLGRLSVVETRGDRCLIKLHAHVPTHGDVQIQSRPSPSTVCRHCNAPGNLQGSNMIPLKTDFACRSAGQLAKTSL